MSLDTFGPIFDGIKLGRQIGIGTEGKVCRVINQDAENKDKSVVKIIRLNYDRLVQENDYVQDNKSFSEIEYCRAMIKNITDNIDLVRKTDGGRFFTRCDDWETKETADGTATLLFIKMEQLTSLSEFLNDFSFTELEVLRLAVCLCQSLDKCRDFGYIYPNLKPENVMFDNQGRCKLGDFGTFSLTAPQKNTIAYRRTQQYMAPEFLQEGKICTSTDTYSLGLVMYVLLNKGRLPFLNPYPAEVTLNDFSQAISRRCAGEEIPAPCLASEQVASIVLRAVSFDPAKRYITPRQMLSQLKAALSGETAQDEPEKEEKPVEVYKEPEIPTDLYEQYETDYTASVQERERKKSEHTDEKPPKPVKAAKPQKTGRQTKSSKPTSRPTRPNSRTRQDLSNIVTYNYKDKAETPMSAAPKKLLILIIIAMLALIAVVIYLAVRTGADVTQASITSFLPETDYGIITAEFVHSLFV